MPRFQLAFTLIGIAAGCALFALLARDAASFDPDDAALGLGTTSHASTFEGEVVSTRSIADPAFCDAIHRFRAKDDSIVLWLGASQLHGVNNLQPGDEVAARYANDRAALRSAKLRYLQLSFANGNFNEFLASYLTLRVTCGIPDWLVIAATYDDLRERGIRQSIVDALPDIGDDLVARFGEGVRNVRTAKDDPGRHAPVQRTVTSGTPQEHLESFLTRGLEAIWPDYSARSKLAAKARLKTAVALAGVAGRLLQRRAPPIPPDMQRWNEAALDSLLRLAAADGVSVLLYQAPHRPDPGPFYHDRAAYDAWNAGLRERAATGKYAVIDLETLVPTEFWGVTNEGRPDVFHFTAEGHRRLGAAIDRWFEEHGARALQ